MTSINSSNTELELSIVVPVHNEKEILESTVRGIVRELEFRSSDFEVILVENGSTDNSGSIIEALSADDSRIVGLHLGKPSYGYALLTGLRSATGKIVGHFSVDIVDFEFFDNALDELKSVDLVLGSKLLDVNQDYRPFHKRIGSQVFHVLSRRFLGVPVVDSHCIKMMNRSVLKSILDRCSGGSQIFDDELVLRASQEGVTMSEIPFRCEEIRSSRIGVLSRSIHALWQLTELRVTLWKERFGK